METLMVTLGGILFPSGLSLFAFGENNKNFVLTVLGAAFAAVGLCSWLVAFKLISDREKHEKSEEARDKAEGILSIARLAQIVYELQQLRQDIKGQMTLPPKTRPVIMRVFRLKEKEDSTWGVGNTLTSKL